MIQRVQTIYLILVTLCLSLTMAFTISSYMVNSNELIYNAMGLLHEGKQLSILPPYLLIIPGAILALVSIFLFKKRKLQLNLNKINYLLILAVSVVIFVDFNGFEKELAVTKEQISYGVGMFLPIAALVFNFLSNRGIKNDDKLISSLDRLR